MPRTHRFIQGALLASAIAFTVSACGQKGTLSSGMAPPSAIQTSAVLSPTPTPAPTPESLKQMKVKGYYSDSEEMKLIEKEVAISYKQESDVYEAALHALQTSDDPQAVPLFDDLKFTSVSMDQAKGELKIDLKFGPTTQLGAPGEDLFLQALEKTAFQFPEIKSLYVLKDGQQVDSLMGHMDLPYPINRSK